MKTTRLQFVQGAMGVCVVGVLTAACGDDSEDSPEGGGGTGGGASGGSCGTTIGSNHNHTLTVTKAQAMAGVAKTYDIQGTATHSHTVELSAEDFADLLDGTVLSLKSSTDQGHDHEVTIDCT